MQQTEMNEAFLNEEKNLKEMATYIKDKAREKASGCVAVIKDEVVFEWAKEYFIKSNEELGIKKQENKNIANNKNINENKNDEFGSIFEVEEDKKSKTVEIEQISLFGM